MLVGKTDIELDCVSVCVCAVVRGSVDHAA